MRDTGPFAWRRLNWTKVHLVYFALAAFDITAIGAGLWLSDRTNAHFDHAVTSVEGGLVLHSHAGHLLEATAQLTGPINDLFVHKDAARARTELQAVAEHFSGETAQDAFKREIGESTGARRRLAGDGEENDAVVFSEVLGISRDIAERWETLEEGIRLSGAEIIGKSRLAIGVFERGDQAAAAALMGDVDLIAREQQYSISKLIETSDEHVRNVVAVGKAQIGENSVYESIIGSVILLIIAAVISYGHFVGRLLRRKYEELETAHAGSLEINAALQGVNDEVTRLNVELSKNVRKLGEAQDENIRRGRMAQLGQLTATVAHELRNPLGAVRTSAFLLERKLKDKNLGIEPQLQRISGGITRCDNIISQLLDYSRSRAVQLEPVRVDDWLAEVVQEEAERLPASVAIECQLGVGHAACQIDPARMRRVIVNLLANASEAMVGTGDDPSRQHCKAPSITVRSGRTARGIEISVTDNGPGINPEHLCRVLEPLFTTKNFGTGLGLPAVEKIMAEHDGGLELRSVPGQGASITVWIPLRVEAAGAA